MKSTNSGVSEVITAILLISLVVSGMAIVAVFVSSLPADTKEVPEISLQVCRDGPDHILLYHDGGDTLQSDEFEVHFLDSEKQIIGDPLPGFEWSIGTRESIPYRPGTEFVQFVSKEKGGDRLIAWSSSERFCSACSIDARIKTDPDPPIGVPPTLVVTFTGITSGTIDTWEWDLEGDGTIDATGQGPHTHTYSEGVYTAQLTATNYCGSRTITKRITVQTCTPPTAGFSASPTSGVAPLDVTFTDASTDATSWEWDFGDGGTSTNQNPDYTYTTPGTYSVMQRVFNSCGDAEERKVDYIIVTEPSLDADFIGTPTIGYAPLTVQFEDRSDGSPTSWSWTFGDGGTSTDKNPEHIYTSPGTYTVTLTIYKDSNSDPETKIAYITVSEDPSPPNLDADFIGTPTTGSAPLTVQFEDRSDGSPTSWSWIFGDGGTSTVQNPEHIYTSPGTYTVTLTIYKGSNSNTETKEAYIVVTVDCIPGIQGLYYPTRFFTGTPVSRIDPRLRFADAAAGEPTDETNWPEGTIGSQNNFACDYQGSLLVPTTGTYTFTLRSDDGSYLWIDNTDTGDTEVIDNWGDHSPRDRSASISLTQGLHPIRVRMYENGGRAVLALSWSGPGFSEEIVDSFCLDCTPPDAAFLATPTTGNAPLDVTFTDASTGTITSWQWDFNGDGTIDSTVQNPPHSFTIAGTYTVTLTVSGDCGTNTSPPQQITVNPQLHKSNLTFPSGFYYGSSGSYKYKKLIDFGSNYAYWEYTTTYNPTSRKAEYPSYKTDTYEAINSAYTLYLQPYNQYYRKSASEVYRLNRWVWNGNTYTGDLFPVPDNTFVEGLSMYYDLEDTFELDFAHPLDGEEVPLGLYRVEVHATGPGVTTSNVYLILPDGSSYKMTYNSSGAYYEYYWDTNPNAGQTVTLTAEVRSTTPYPQTTVTVIVACTPPTAVFSANPTTGYAPLAVTFTDASTGTITSWQWDFNGDGTIDSTVQNPPQYTYTTAGTYTASLTVTGPCGTSTITHEIVVSTCTPPTAAFSANPTTGYAPLDVMFTDASTGTITTWQWDFNGDGTIDSTVQNPPQYTYTTAGTFNAQLTVTGPCGTNFVTHQIVVSTCTPPVAVFSATPTSGYAPLAVTFTEASTGTITTWQWDFNGDGTIDSTVQNPPLYTYTNPGTYNAQLTVTGPCGTSTITHPITVQQQCYTLSGTVTVIGGTLNPSNLRIMAIRHNGPTFYAIPQTNGAYIIDVTNPGTYTISIENCPGSSCSGYLVSPLSYERKLTGGDCFATGINFQVSCTPPTASFTVNPETGYAPLTAVFTDTSSGDHSSVAWDFGDGTTGTGSPVTHEYENPDTYTATMTVSGSCGSDIATKTIIAIRYPGFTVESWIRWTSTPNPGSDSTRQWATIVVDGNTDNNRRYHLQHDQTNAHFEFVVATVAGGGSGTWIFSTTSPVINTWYYVTGVYNQVTGIMAIYVNGVQQASRNIGTSGLRVSPGIYQVGGPSGINWGGSSGQRIFDGDTSGLATYEYVLTTAEIQAHYAAGHS